MDNAIGLGIILSLQDKASSGLDAVRKKMTALRDVSKEMVKQFDIGARQMIAGFASIAAGAKVLGVLDKMLGTSVDTAADFEQAMARVGAVSGATGADFEALSKQARDLGRDTQYSATQAANSQELLARAGFQTNEIISAMPGLLNMAAAEGMDLANAADIASSALRGFGMSADEMNRVADVLAKTSSASNTSISILGESLKYVAKPAAALGFEIEQVNAMLGVMANAGIKGSMAGTSLKAAFLRLSKEPKQVAKALAELGVQSLTAQGDLRPLPELMLDLANKMKDMGKGVRMKYLANIFGAEAASGMLAIMESAVDTSDKGLSALERALYGCSGAAKQMADRMNATAQGAIKRLESASEGLRIVIGNHLLPVYTEAIDLMAQFKSWLTQTIEEHPILAKAVIGLTTAVLGLAGGALILVGALVSIGGMIKIWPLMRDMAGLALTHIKNQARSAIKALTGIKVPVVGMIALAGALYYAWRKNLFGIRDMVEAVTQGFKLAWSAGTDGIAEIDEELVNKLKKSGVFDYAVLLGQVFFRIRKFWDGLVKGFQEGLDFIKSSFKLLGDIFFPFIKGGEALLKFLGILKPVADSYTSTWEAWGQLIGRITPAILTVIAAFKGMRIIKFIFADIRKAVLGVFHIISAHPFAAIITGLVALGIYLYTHWNEIKAYFKDMWGKIKEWGTATADWIEDKWKAFGKWWDSWKLSDIFDILGKYVDDVIAEIKQKWENFKTWLSNLFANLNPFNWEIPSWLGGGKAGENQVNNAFSALNGSTYTPPSIVPAQNANGGIINSPVLSWVGEAGREAIIPLENREKGVPLWIEAGYELGMLPSSNTTVNNTNIEHSVLRETLDKIIKTNAERSVLNSNRSATHDTSKTSLLQKLTNTVSPILLQPDTEFTVRTGTEQILQQHNNTAKTTARNYSESYNVVDQVINTLMPKVEAPVKIEREQPVQQMNSYSPDLSKYDITTQATKNLALDTRPEQILQQQVISNNSSEVKTYDALSQVINALKSQAITSISTSSMSSLTQEAPLKLITSIPSLMTGASEKEYETITVPIFPHATGGIFSTPHIGLVAEAGSEAIIPLENKARGIPLLMSAANELMGDTIMGDSSQMLVQHMYNQAALNNQYSSNEISAMGSNRVSDSKVTVNVDVKPADVYIDSERIGRISFRWSERQSIRRGLGS